MSDQLHPVVRELARLMPPSGSVWSVEDRVIFMRAFDAILAYLNGGGTHLIWLDENGEIQISKGSMDVHGKWSDEKDRVRARAMDELL